MHLESSGTKVFLNEWMFCMKLCVGKKNEVKQKKCIEIEMNVKVVAFNTFDVVDFGAAGLLP